MSDQQYRWEQRPQYAGTYDRSGPRPTSYHEQQYAAYDFDRHPSSTASALLPEYRPQAGHLPPPAYPSSHSSSNRSRSSSAEQQGVPSHAPVHSTYVIPSQHAGHHHTHSQETISPSSIYQHQVSASPVHYSPPTPLVDTFPPGTFSRPASRSDYASAPLRRAPSFPNSRNGGSSLPAGLVSNVDTWTGTDASASASTSSLDLTGPPNIELSRPPASRKRSATAAATAEKQAPRRRVPASCTPCRKKKLRCNRSMPCSSCVERGEPSGCIWEGCVRLHSLQVGLLTSFVVQRRRSPLHRSAGERCQGAQGAGRPPPAPPRRAKPCSASRSSTRASPRTPARRPTKGSAIPSPSSLRPECTGFLRRLVRLGADRSCTVAPVSRLRVVRPRRHERRCLHLRRGTLPQRQRETAAQPCDRGTHADLRRSFATFLRRDLSRAVDCRPLSVSHRRQCRLPQCPSDHVASA